MVRAKETLSQGDAAALDALGDVYAMVDASERRGRNRLRHAVSAPSLRHNLDNFGSCRTSRVRTNSVGPDTAAYIHRRFRASSGLCGGYFGAHSEMFPP